jgi:hypothetical protein
MVYDPVRGGVVLFGGRDNNSSFGDTWEFDGRTWTKIDVPGPSPRNAHAMVYDPQIKAICLFGGRHGRENLNDFWKFDGAWAQINPEPGREPGAGQTCSVTLPTASVQLVRRSRSPGCSHNEPGLRRSLAPPS